MHRVLSFKKLQPWNKIEVAILNFDDVATFNCVFCDFTAHLTFQMRKVLVTRNPSQTARHLPPGGLDG